jgi:hypothetical protein
MNFESGDSVEARQYSEAIYFWNAVIPMGGLLACLLAFARTAQGVQEPDFRMCLTPATASSELNRAATVLALSTVPSSTCRYSDPRPKTALLLASCPSGCGCSSRPQPLLWPRRDPEDVLPGWPASVQPGPGLCPNSRISQAQPSQASWLAARTADWASLCPSPC